MCRARAGILSQSATLCAKAEMVTRCRDDPENVKWKLVKMGAGAPTDGGSRPLLECAPSCT